ncbi:MAG: hypothetical protein KAT17_03790, partial [Candidatus Aminicenantes bacterium]|nr:hypothetical protein [Candidatus Aminicenantes bacterium]
MKGLNSLMNFRKIWILPGIISLFVSLLVGKAGILVISLSGAVIIILELLFDFRKNIQQNPYFLMIFSPLFLIHYSTINDFIIRIICF